MENGDGILDNLYKDGKVSFKTRQLLSEEAFCETFHKLPYEVDKMDADKYDYFCAILRGRNNYHKKQNAKK